jgi:hypothetical protein
MAQMHTDEDFRIRVSSVASDPSCLSVVVNDFFRGLHRRDHLAFRAETIRDSPSSSLRVFTKRTHGRGRYLNLRI